MHESASSASINACNFCCFSKKQILWTQPISIQRHAEAVKLYSYWENFATNIFSCTMAIYTHPIDIRSSATYILLLFNKWISNPFNGHTFHIFKFYPQTLKSGCIRHTKRTLITTKHNHSAGNSKIHVNSFKHSRHIAFSPLFRMLILVWYCATWIALDSIIHDMEQAAKCVSVCVTNFSFMHAFHIIIITISITVIEGTLLRQQLRAHPPGDSMHFQYTMVFDIGIHFWRFSSGCLLPSW